MSGKPVYAFTIQPTHLYGSTQIRATIVRITDDGEIRNPGYDYGIDDAHFNDLMVSAYVNDTGESAGNVYGLSVDYRDVFSVDLKRAEGMVKLLRKVTRGMDKLNDAEGYVSEGAYAAYLLRVARVLGIRTFYVRNDRDARARSGERWRKGTGSTVAYYIDTVQTDIAKGNVGNYDN